MFDVTLIALPQPGVSKARLTVTADEKYTVILEVVSGSFAQKSLQIPPGAVQIVVTLQLNDAGISTGRVQNVPSDGSLHVQVVGKVPNIGGAYGIGHFKHAPGMLSLEVWCDGPSGRKVTCPGSITCDDLTLTC